MPRTKGVAKIDNRTARERITRGSRVAVPVDGTRSGLALVYRRSRAGPGTWQARRWTGTEYLFQGLGDADDDPAADARKVLTYTQALLVARSWARESTVRRGEDKPAAAPGTVADALDRYLVAYEGGTTKRGAAKAVKTTRNTVDRMIRPELGALRLAALTTERLRSFLQTLAARGRSVRVGKGKESKHAPAASEPDAIRARRATANRIFNVLRAALNLAYQEGRVTSDEAWRRVSPFANVDEPRIRFLTAPESMRLVNACSIGLRPLVRAALLTGGRFGELAALIVRDFNADTRQIYIAPSKGGRARYVPLNDEGMRFFGAHGEGRAPGDRLVTRDGSAWGKNQYVRPLQAACAAANVTPAITLHELRHTYASLLAQAGCDLLTISKLLGHSDTRVTSRHYAHLCDRTLAAAVTRLPAFVDEPSSNVATMRGKRRAGRQ